MVIPTAKEGDIAAQCLRVFNKMVLQAVFKGAKKALNLAIHPRTTFLSMLVFNAQHPKAKPK